MKLTPRPWTWPSPHLVEGWLNECPNSVPVVWQAVVTDDAAILSDLISRVSAEERGRLERLQQPDDRRRFLIGRGLLRLLAGAQLGLPPERVEFQHGPFGKPLWFPAPAQTRCISMWLIQGNWFCLPFIWHTKLAWTWKKCATARTGKRSRNGFFQPKNIATGRC
jgi:hypothetical protein